MSGTLDGRPVCTRCGVEYVGERCPDCEREAGDVTSPEGVLADVLAMRDALRDAGQSGPYVLRVSQSVARLIDEDMLADHEIHLEVFTSVDE